MRGTAIVAPGRAIIRPCQTHLTSAATPDETADALSFALQYQGLQRDQRGEHSRDRHKHRDRDAIRASERIGRAEGDDRAERANGKEPIHQGI